MPKSRFKSRLAILGAATLVVMAGAAAAAIASGNNNKPSQSHKPRLIHRHSVAAKLRQSFAVLRNDRLIARTASASDGAEPLPEGVTNAIENSANKGGLEPSKAVFTGGADPTWIVPGEREVCLIHAPTKPNGNPGGICSPVSSAAEQGIVGSTENASGERLILGLVPDGNTSIQVADASETSSAPVTNNVYEVTNDDPVTIKLKTASGKVISQQLPRSHAAP